MKMRATQAELTLILSQHKYVFSNQKTLVFLSMGCLPAWYLLEPIAIIETDTTEEPICINFSWKARN